MSKQTKKRVWDISIGILVIIHLVLVTNIFILHKKIAILKDKQENTAEEKRTSVLPVKKLAVQAKSLKEKVKKNPKDTEARKNLAHFHYKQGKIDSAMSQYQKSLEINPNNSDTHFSLGVLHIGKEQNSQAIHHFEKVLELSANHSKKDIILKWLAKLRKRKSDTGLSLSFYQKKKSLLEYLTQTLKKYPNHPNKAKIKSEKEALEKFVLAHKEKIAQLEKKEQAKLETREGKIEKLRNVLKIQPNHPLREKFLEMIQKLEKN